MFLHLKAPLRAVLWVKIVQRIVVLPLENALDLLYLQRPPLDQSSTPGV